MAKKTKLVRVWRPCYRPFMLDGDVHTPVCADLPVEGPFELGMGFEGYVAAKPDGSFAIFEKISGGWVGDSLDGVKADIRRAALSTMERQVREATKKGKTASLVTADKFWSIH